MRIFVFVLILTTSMLLGCSKEAGQGQPTKQEESNQATPKESAARRVFDQIDGSKRIMKKQSSSN